MATQKQIEANRRNAQKSTGPKTPKGKSIVAQNATTHGLRTSRILIASENPDEFEVHQNALFEDLAPVGPMEIILANRIVKLTWQLDRATRLQSESIDALTSEQRRVQQEQQPKQILEYSPALLWDSGFLKGIGITEEMYYEEYEDDDEKLEKYIKECLKQRRQKAAQEAQEAAQQPDDLLGLVAVQDFSDTRVLERLAMYERRIESSLFKTQLQLEHLQLRRRKKEADDERAYLEQGQNF